MQFLRFFVLYQVKRLAIEQRQSERVRKGLEGREEPAEDLMLAQELNEYLNEKRDLNGKYERHSVSRRYVIKDRIIPEFFSLPFIIVELDEENLPISKCLPLDANGNLREEKPTKMCHRRIAIKMLGPRQYLHTYHGKHDTKVKPTTRLDLSLVEKLGYEVVVADYRQVRDIRSRACCRQFVEHLALKLELRKRGLRPRN